MIMIIINKIKQIIPYLNTPQKCFLLLGAFFIGASTAIIVHGLAFDMIGPVALILNITNIVVWIITYLTIMWVAERRRHLFFYYTGHGSQRIDDDDDDDDDITKV